MVVDERRGTLYSVDEQKNSPAFAMQGGGGRIAAFSIDPESGLLSELGDEQPSFGTLADYVAEDPGGNWLVVVNHGDKQTITKAVKDADGVYRVKTEFSDVTASLYPLDADGSILPAADVLFFPPDRSRMPVSLPCLHSVYFAHDGEHLIVMNMKQDEVIMLHLDKIAGKLSVCGKLKCRNGTWPRYGVFHPVKDIYYFNNEHALLVNALSYNAGGEMKLIQTVDSTPGLSCVQEGRRISQSDIRISRDGRFIYDFYRYTDCAAVFAVNPEDGRIRMIQSMELTEKKPRGCCISPDGRFMLVANMNGSISTMAIGPDGCLSETGIVDRHMKYPGNIVFYQPRC